MNEFEANRADFARGFGYKDSKCLLQLQLNCDVQVYPFWFSVSIHE